MPLPRKVVPPDPPEVIEARDRERPEDVFTVLCKNNDGEIVSSLSSGMEYPWPDRIKRPYAPWREPLDKAATDKLKKGVAEQYEFHWVSKNPLRLGEAKGKERWRPVKKSDNLVLCPYAYGEETDGFIHHVDVMLHMRDRAYGDQVRKGQALLHNPRRIIADAAQSLGDETEKLMSQHGKKAAVIAPTLEEVPTDAKKYEAVVE